MRVVPPVVVLGRPGPVVVDLLGQQRVIRHDSWRSGSLLEDVDAARGAQADDVGQANLGALDLTVAGLTPQVVADLPDVGDAGRRDRVTLRLEATGHVDRELAVAPRGTGLEERHRVTR